MRGLCQYQIPNGITAMLKAALLMFSITAAGPSPVVQVGVIVNLDVCNDLTLLLNEGPQPDGKLVLFTCREEPATPQPKKTLTQEIRMQTTYTLYLSDGTTQQHTVELPDTPGFHDLSKIIRPLIGKGRDFERVNVFHEGRYTDMFVDDEGVIDGLPINHAATAIYRNNVLTHVPGSVAEDQPAIHGPAVLFDQKVWF